MEYKPDFIIAGTARAGSTMLAGCLNSHPDVYMPVPFIPEPKVFTDINMVDNAYLDRYRNIFRDRKEKVKGEKTVNYLENPKIAQKIKAVLPDVIMIFILRNPIERAVSNWRWSTQNKYEILSFEDAIRKEIEDKRHKIIPNGLKSSPFNYLHRGKYCELLSPYYKEFCKKQIIVIGFEYFIKNIQIIIDKIFCKLRLVSKKIDISVIDKNKTINNRNVVFSPGLREELEIFFCNENKLLNTLI